MNYIIKYRQGRNVLTLRCFAMSKSEAFKKLPKRHDGVISWAAWKY